MSLALFSTWPRSTADGQNYRSAQACIPVKFYCAILGNSAQEHHRAIFQLQTSYCAHHIQYYLDAVEVYSRVKHFTNYLDVLNYARLPPPKNHKLVMAGPHIFSSPRMHVRDGSTHPDRHDPPPLILVPPHPRPLNSGAPPSCHHGSRTFQIIPSPHIPLLYKCKPANNESTRVTHAPCSLSRV